MCKGCCKWTRAKARTGLVFMKCSRVTRRNCAECEHWTENNSYHSVRKDSEPQQPWTRAMQTVVLVGLFVLWCWWDNWVQSSRSLWYQMPKQCTKDSAHSSIEGAFQTQHFKHNCSVIIYHFIIFIFSKNWSYFIIHILPVILWKQTKQVSPDVPLPSNIFQLILREPEAFSSQIRYVIFPACSGSMLGFPVRMCLENLQGKALRRRPDQMPWPTPLAPFDTIEQHLYPELPLDVWTPLTIYHEETYFVYLCPGCPYFFLHRNFLKKKKTKQNKTKLFARNVQ